MNSDINSDIIMQNFVTSNELIGGVQLNDLPQIIDSQVVQIKKLSRKIETAVKKAGIAKGDAETAKGKSAGFGHKKKAIEALQDATSKLAEAQCGMADALEVSFEYEKKLGDITKYLFALGAYSIANSQIVIQQLAEELAKDGKSNKISDIAKQQLITVINQLKAQEEVMKRQEVLTDKIDEHAGQIREIDLHIDNMEETDKVQNEKIAVNVEKLTKHDRVLSAQQEKDKEHDNKILENSKKIAEHKATLAEQQLKDEKLDQKINENSEKIQHFEVSLKQQVTVQEKKNTEFEERTNELSQSFSKELDNLKDDIAKNNESVQNHISLITESFNTQIAEVKTESEEKNISFEKKLESIAKEHKADIIKLREETTTKNKELENKLTELTDKLNAINVRMNKKIWKIAISVVAAGSLVLNILQITGVL